MGDGKSISKTVVRSRDKKYVFRQVAQLKRQGWEQVEHWKTGEVIEPKAFLMLDGTEEWVCVMKNKDPKTKNKNHPFLKHYE
jgi:hypothetical protein